MQQEKSKTRAYLERTDRLAEKLQISLRELAGRMYVSQATLFGCRSGKIPVSRKTSRRLEQLEHAAGLLSADENARLQKEYMVNEPFEAAARASEMVQGAPETRKAAFAEFLAEIQAIRAEAELAAQGNREKAIDLFDAYLAVWMARLSMSPRTYAFELRRPSASKGAPQGPSA